MHVDGKNVFPPVELNDIDSAAMDNLFNNSIDDDLVDTVAAENSGRTDINQLHDLNLASNERAALNEKGQIEITRVSDDDCAITYIHGETLVPKNPLFEVKVNDLLTGNIPFKENVREKNYAQSFQFNQYISLFMFVFTL